MSEGLNKRRSDIFTWLLIFWTAQPPPIKYIPQVVYIYIEYTCIQVYRCTRSSHSAISADTPLFLQGRGQKVQNLASIFDTTLLWAALISKRSNALVPKYRIWCSNDETLFSTNLVQFSPPPLKSRVWKSATLKNCEIVNNLTVDCSISFAFCTNFYHVTSVRTANVQGQRVKGKGQRYITNQHQKPLHFTNG